MMTTVYLCWAIALGTTLFVLYPFTVYPLLLWIVAKVRPRPWLKKECTPHLSIIIAAHNAKEHIHDKILNTLQFKYPENLREIIVVSDGSTDNTEEIVASFSPRVKLVRSHGRRGKQIALNKAIAASSGEVLILTDVGALFDEETLEKLTRHFADPKIGAVSSALQTCKRLPKEAAATGHGEGEYLGIDFMIRRLEGKVASLTGCSGPLYAVRRECFIPFEASVCNDFMSALDVVKTGYRCILENEVIGYTHSDSTNLGEFWRKVRTITGGMDTLWKSRAFLSGFGQPLFWWEIMSHKVVRWLAPIAAFVGLSACVVGAMQGDTILEGIAVTGIFAIGTGLLGVTVPTLGRSVVPVRILTFAFISAVAGIYAWREFLSGRKYTHWRPTRRRTVYTYNPRAAAHRPTYRR